jgi:hypothetical protein
MVNTQTIQFVIPHKADYITVIERVVWDTRNDVNDQAGGFFEILLMVGPPYPPPWIADMLQRIVWMYRHYAGNHVNEELNLTLEGGKPYCFYLQDFTDTNLIVSLLVTIRYERRPSEGKTHGG